MNRAKPFLAAAFPGRCRMPAANRFSRCFPFFLFIVFLVYSVPSVGQTMDSTDLPVLWLRADSCAAGGGAWKDLKQWKEDSLGCQHGRTIGSFERLLNGYSLAQKNEAEIVQVLGPPNAEERYPGKSIAIYYFESVCAANKIIKGSDKSSIMLTFDEQKRYQRYDTRIE
jgi:hypothetical protein